MELGQYTKLLCINIYDAQSGQNISIINMLLVYSIVIVLCNVYVRASRCKRERNKQKDICMYMSM